MGLRQLVTVWSSGHMLRRIKGRGGGYGVGTTHHTAPAVPAGEAVAILQQLNDVEFVVVVPDIGLVQGTVVVFMYLVQRKRGGFQAKHGAGLHPDRDLRESGCRGA